MLLGQIETVLAQWRRRPTRENAQLLEDTYVRLVVGGLGRLAPASATSGSTHYEGGTRGVGFFN